MVCSNDNMHSTQLPVIDLEPHSAVSPCPYARRKITTVGMTLTTEAALPRAASLLRSYSRNLGLHDASMFAIQVCAELIPRGMSSLASLFHYLVHDANSTQLGRDNLYANILEPTWRLNVEGTALFAVILSPLYPITHHRYTEPLSLILFQPENLFTALGITNGPSRSTLSQAVANRFARAGRPYTSAHLRGIPKSLRIVLKPDGHPIEWWRLPLPTLDESLSP
jgi:hypothetical protein